MIKAVIFDLDDTLISERDYINSGFKYIAQLLSEKSSKSTDDLYSMLQNLFISSPDKVFNRLLDCLNIVYTEDDIMELVHAYRNHNPKIHLLEDVVPCIDWLRRNGFKLGIITDGYFESQYKKLQAINAYELFDEIIITDELGREYWKPHPKSFEIMKQRLNVEYGEMIYVGDNPTKDFYIRKWYPIITVRCYRNGIYNHSDYKDGIKEVHSVTSLDQLRNICDKYGRK